MQQLLYSVTKAAGLLGISRQTLYRWIAQQIVFSRKINGQHRIPSSEISRLTAA